MIGRGRDRNGDRNDHNTNAVSCRISAPAIRNSAENKSTQQYHKTENRRKTMDKAGIEPAASTMPR